MPPSTTTKAWEKGERVVSRIAPGMNPGEATTPNVPGSITDPPFLEVAG
jgi:hypothetical protein